MFQVAWVKADSQTLLSIGDAMISRNYRLKVSHTDANTWFLHIEKATLSDRGYYMCQINTVPMKYEQGFLQVVGKRTTTLLKEHRKCKYRRLISLLNKCLKYRKLSDLSRRLGTNVSL